MFQVSGLPVEKRTTGTRTCGNNTGTPPSFCMLVMRRRRRTSPALRTSLLNANSKEYVRCADGQPDIAHAARQAPLSRSPAVCKGDVVVCDNRRVWHRTPPSLDEACRRHGMTCGSSSPPPRAAFAESDSVRPAVVGRAAPPRAWRSHWH